MGNRMWKRRHGRALVMVLGFLTMVEVVAMAAQQLLAESAANVELGGGRQTVPLAIAPDQKAALLALAKRPVDLTQRVVLVLDVAGYEPGAFYTLYLNLPESETSPSPESPHYVGVLSPFAMKAPRGAPARAEAPGAGEQEATQDFELTRVISALAGEQRWKGDAVAVTFMPGGLERPSAAGGSPTAGVKADTAEPRTGKVRLTRMRIVSTD